MYKLEKYKHKLMHVRGGGDWLVSKVTDPHLDDHAQKRVYKREYIRLKTNQFGGATELNKAINLVIENKEGKDAELELMLSTAFLEVRISGMIDTRERACYAIAYSVLEGIKKSERYPLDWLEISNDSDLENIREFLNLIKKFIHGYFKRNIDEDFELSPFSCPFISITNDKISTSKAQEITTIINEDRENEDYDMWCNENFELRYNTNFCKHIVINVDEKQLLLEYSELISVIFDEPTLEEFVNINKHLFVIGQLIDEDNEYKADMKGRIMDKIKRKGHTARSIAKEISIITGDETPEQIIKDIEPLFQ